LPSARGVWRTRSGRADGPSGQDEYDAKLDVLAATITDLVLDVLAVPEVGDPEALEDLANCSSGCNLSGG
jgi:hypothetical protein